MEKGQFGLSSHRRCGRVCIRWYFHIPPPSYSVTFMAVAAGLMALRPEMGGREKWLWTLVLFAFAVVEIFPIKEASLRIGTNFFTFILLHSEIKSFIFFFGSINVIILELI